jgi:hypothetical protein
VTFKPDFPKLPDGRTVVPTLHVAHRWGVTPPTVPVVAEREGIERYGRKGPGGISYYYLEEDVERIRNERIGVVPMFTDSEFAPVPYKKKKSTNSAQDS